jgi:glycosyltransferase involved in cell wall biosynthesis
VLTPLVSIVVTTKNEERNIQHCLESIKEQTWNNIEIIVIDNSSNDKTQDISKKYTGKVYTKGPERSAQRNYGMIEKSKGEYVIYIDADMILSPILIESCVKYIRQTQSVALHVVEIVLGKNYFSRVRRFERSFYDGTVIDGARFFHRPTFIKSGGFDENLFVKGSGEDWDIDKIVKHYGAINLLPRYSCSEVKSDWTLKNFIENLGASHASSFSGIYHNESEFKLWSYLKKKSYYSAGFDGYIDKWGLNDPDICKQFGLIYRFWTVFTENGKWKKLLLHPLLTIGMYFLRVLVGFVYIIKKFIR